MTRLTGQTALITGGGHGLGAAIARRFAAEGAHVAVADIDPDAAQQVADEIAGTAITADVTQAADVQRMVVTATRAAGNGGNLRILVLSAAVEQRKSVVECSDEEWDHTLAVNLKGPFLCMKYALPHIIASGGSVIALGSTLGLIVAPQYAAYCASKGALGNLCKQAAIEHASDGVRINVIAPSATDTGLFMKLPDAVRDQVAASMPMGRLARSEEVCDAAVFLASDESSYISGTVLAVDGGLAARRL
jgi:NAD(P)-dependent dehydrogenase (short-subunit alcohol dehydrogenase family)